jgi:Peptidase family M50
MRALKSILCWTFAVSALVFLQFAIGTLHLPHAGKTSSMLVRVSLPVVFAALTVLFAMACWTTRKASASRNWWAIVASFIHLLASWFALYLEYRYAIRYGYFMRRFSFADPNFLLVAIGIAGIVAFSRRIPLPEQAPVRTPIAGDRTSLWFGRIVTWLSYAAQYCGVWIWMRYAYSHDLPFDRGIPFFGILLLAIFATATMHECGHAAVAWIFEMRLLAFSAGPFRWQRQSGVWKFKFRPGDILDVGGAVNVVPTNEKQPRWHELCMLTAGPFVNLCVGLAALFAALHADGAFSVRVWEFIAILASSCLIAAVENMLPYRIETGAYTDGARILQLLTNSPMAELHRAMMAMQSTTVTPRRFRDMDPQPFQRAIELFPNDLTGVYLRIVIAQHFEEAGNIPQACASISVAEAIYDQFKIDLPAGLHTCFIISRALLSHDAAATRLWWDRMQEKKPTRFNVDYWLAHACVLWMEGRLDEANDALRKADAEARKLPQAGAYEFDRSRCALLRRELDLASTIAVQRPIIPLVLADLRAGMPLQTSLELA